MTTNQPPRRVKVLTRLKISEVSMVDRGAGERCRVLISKRADDSADDNHTDLSVEEIARAKMEGRRALRDAEEMYTKQDGTGAADHDDRTGPLFEHFLGIFKGTNKSFAAAARGDEADRHDERVRAHTLAGGGEPPPPDVTSDGVPKKHRPIAFDTVDGTRMQFPNERSLAEWLAIQSRIHKSTEDSNPMSTTLDLSAIVKSYGITALAKHIASEGKSFGISETELTQLATEDAQRRFPTDRADVAFAKLYSSDEGISLRQAIEIAKAAPMQNADAEAEKEAAEACCELAEIGKARWPSLTRAAQFARAFETNPELAKRAHRRPSVFSTSYPFPK